MYGVGDKVLPSPFFPPPFIPFGSKLYRRKKVTSLLRYSKIRGLRRKGSPMMAQN